MDCIFSEDTMANAGELTRTVDRLEERVANHIKFFWVVCSCAALWLAALSYAIFDMHGKITNLGLPQRLSKSAEAPTDRKSQTEAIAALATVRKESIPVPASVIGDVGKRFVDAASKDEGAWKVALDFTAYRTSLNVVSLPDPSLQINATATTSYFIQIVPDRPRAALQWISPIVPATSAAHLELIGQDQNINTPVGPSTLQLTNGATNLDGMRIKQVIFNGVEIHYSGKAVILDNVIFINCTFVFDNTERSRQLVGAMLKSGTVNFTDFG